MPISAENKKRYLKDWKAISLRIRTERAKGWCEFCRIAENGKRHPVTGSKVVLTVAHLNHRPEDCSDDNLAAMCQRGHLTYDAQHHAETRRRTLRKRKACADLFEGEAA